MSSYYGNSLGQITQNSEYDSRFSTIESTAVSDKAYLVGLVSAEASSRTSADGVLDARITSEKSFLMDRIGDEAVSRTSADALLRTDLNAEITLRDSLTTGLRTDLTAEGISRANADALLRTDLNSEIATRTSADALLRTDLNSEIATRIFEDGVLNSRITTEKSFLMDRIADEATARIAEDDALDAKIDAREAYIVNAMNTAVASLTLADSNEATARASADTTLSNRITTLDGQVQAGFTQEQSRYVSTNSRLNALESGLASQVQAMIDNNALDVVQSNLITQYANSLGQADSVIYTKIAEKASLIMNNTFKSKFNEYINDFFDNYTMKSGPSGARINKYASDYLVSQEVSVNDDPTIVPASYVNLMSVGLSSDSAPSPYVSYASSIIGAEYQSYKAFNGIKGKAEDNFGWHSGVNSYPEELGYGGGYFTATTIVSGVEVKGEWVELGRTDTAFDNVKEVVLYGSSTLVNQRFPKRVMVAGSNDRATWHKMMDSQELLGADLNYTEDASHITNTQRLLINHVSSYKYLRLIVMKLRATDYPCLIEVEYKKA